MAATKQVKVLKSKKLNRAQTGLTKTEYDVYLALISKIKHVDGKGLAIPHEELERNYTLTAKEYSELLNCDIKNAYGIIKKACQKLIRTPMVLDKPELGQTREIAICAQADYNHKEGSIKIEFTPNIMPFLARLQNNFVMYNLKSISNFKSLYTVRLYELLQEFSDQGFMTKSVEELRRIFNAENKFMEYSDLKRRTFQNACDEINLHFDMKLTFQEITASNSKKVERIDFTFKPTIVNKFIDSYTGKPRNQYIGPKKHLPTEDELEAKRIKAAKAKQYRDTHKAKKLAAQSTINNEQHQDLFNSKQTTTTTTLEELIKFNELMYPDRIKKLEEKYLKLLALRDLSPEEEQKDLHQFLLSVKTQPDLDQVSDSKLIFGRIEQVISVTQG